MKTYFLFGKDAVNFYHWDELTSTEKARKLLNELTYDPWDVYVCDSTDFNPVDLLNAFKGHTDYCVITEEFYHLLK